VHDVGRVSRTRAAAVNTDINMEEHDETTV
jgi:hypothetical protein